MTHLLDTNAWIAYLRRSNLGLIARLESEPPVNLALCSVVVGELYFGAYRGGAAHLSSNLQLVANLQGRFVSISFDDAAGQIYGRIRAALAAAGKPIGHNDLMIAAIALANGLTLVTHNMAEFSRVPGLLLEDWQSP